MVTMAGMRRLLLILFLFSFSSAWGAEPIGKVIDITGESWITHPSKKSSIAFLNREIYLGDAVKTTKSGAVKILFIDDTMLTVKEDSSVLVSEFLFNPKKKERKVTLNATYGRVRALIGKFFGKDQPVEIYTPTAVAGIRGTDVGIAATAQSSTVYCFICEELVFSVHNIDFVNKQVSLASGQAIEIFKHKAALQEAIVPIPEDILDKKEILFDIQKGETAKAVESATKEATKETTGTVVAVKESSVEKLPVLDQVKETKSQEEAITTTPGNVDTSTAVNPGGTLQNSAVHVTLIIPGS